MNRNDTKEQLDVIWEALHTYRNDLIPEGNEQYDDIWSDICTAMAWIEEDLIGENDETHTLY
jgi:hypothetical protein